ncbi:UNVERIFIED_CONTAM: hypothetical protein Sindi_1852900 [Sesamum indicum]
MRVPATGSLFEARDGPLEMTNFLFFYRRGETFWLIHVDQLLDEIVQEGHFNDNLPYFVDIPSCYGKQYPNGISHCYERIGFLKVDPELLSVSFAMNLALKVVTSPLAPSLRLYTHLQPTGLTPLGGCTRVKA